MKYHILTRAGTIFFAIMKKLWPLIKFSIAKNTGFTVFIWSIFFPIYLIVDNWVVFVSKQNLLAAVFSSGDLGFELLNYVDIILGHYW